MSNSTATGTTTQRAQPESLRGRPLWASITASDLTRSMHWYVDIVGFTIDQRYEHEGKLMGVTLKAGDVRLFLGQDDGAKGWDRVKGEGISLQIMTAQNVDEIAARIKERGAKLDSEPMDMPWGARIFRLCDPDGFKFTISSDVTP